MVKQSSVFSGMRRPEGWERPHRFVRTPSLEELVEAQNTDEVKFYQNEAFEAGADALLEALQKFAEKEAHFHLSFIEDDGSNTEVESLHIDDQLFVRLPQEV